VLRHLVLVQQAADSKADLVFSAKRSLLPLRRSHDLFELLLGRRQELAPLAAAFFGQKRVATNHQTLAGEVL